MAEGVTVGEAIVRVRADTKEATSAISALGATAGKALGGLAVSGFFAKGIQGIQNVEKRTAQLEARLKSTGGAAGMSASQIKGLSSELNSLTGIAKGSIEEAETLLLTFKSINNSGPDRTFERATKAALDLSVAFGSDLKGATVMVGKALEDPISGVTALRRVGVQLSEQQQQMIADMVAAGDAAGAQGVILDELASQVGGAAEAYGGTLSAQIDRVQQKFTALAMAASQALIPAIEAIANVALPVFTGLAGILNALPDPVAKIGTLLAVAFGASKFAMVQKLTAGIKALTLTQGALGVAIAGAAIAWQKWQEGITAAKDAASSLDERVKASYGNYDAMKAKLDALNVSISDVGRSVEKSRAPWDADYRAQLLAFNDGLQDTRDALEKQIRITEGLAAAQGISSQEAAAQMERFADLGIEINSVSDASLAYTGGADAIEAANARVAQSLKTAKDRADEYASALSALTDPVLGAVDAERRMADAQQDLADAQKERREATTREDAAAADKRIEEARLATVKAAQDVDASRMRLGASLSDDPAVIQQNIDKYKSWADAGLITTATLDMITGAIGKVSDASLPQIIDEMTKRADLMPETAAGSIRYLEDLAAKANTSADALKRIQEGIEAIEATQPAQSAFTSPAARDKFFADYELAQRRTAATNAYIASYGPRPRAIGGPVAAGTPYRVGELGPETFTDSQGRRFMIPAEPGHVSSTPSTPGPTTTTINVVVNGSATETDAHMMIAALRSEAWLVGAGG